MKYLLLVCWDAEKMNADDEPTRTEEPESFPWLDDLQARNAWIIGDQVAAPKRARSVQVRGGRTLVTDGPFADTKEAVEIAAAHPVAAFGTIEVRQLLGS